MAGNPLDGDLAGVIYKQTGYTSTINSSFSSPTTSVVGITWDGTNVLSTENVNDKIYLHSGFTSTISNSFSSPTADPEGLSWDSANVLSSDDGSFKLYKHTGFSSTISSSFSSPSNGPYGVAWDSTNILSADYSSTKIYQHSGFTSTITTSFSSPSSGVRALGYDSANTLSTDVASTKIYQHSGFSSTITTSFSSPSTQPRGVADDSWSGSAPPATLAPSVTDSSAVSDTPTIRLFSYVNVLDTPTVSDTPTLSLTSYINVSDSSTIGDAITIQVIYFFTVSDSSPIGESVTLRLFSNISVNDPTQVQESIIMSSVIVFDNTANFSSALTSISGSYTTAGTNRGLVAFVYSASSLFDISNPTYGGVVMENADEVQLPAGYTGFVAAYYMTNPTVGSNTFAVVRSGTGTIFRAVVASYYNVEQDNSPDATSTATVLLSNTITATVATTANNDWTIMGVVSGLSGTLSAGSGSFARTNVSPLWLFDSNSAVGLPGNYSMTVTSSAPTDGMAAVILSIEPYIFFSTQPFFSTGNDIFVFDTPTLYITTLMFSVSDSTAVSDTSTVYVTTLFLSVSDSTAVSDTITSSFGLSFSVVDSTLLVEILTFSGQMYIDWSESQAVLDNVTISLVTSSKGYSFVVWID